MAPEVISNSNGYKFSVDLWSLGCTILEMATAKPPWSQYEGAAAISKICNSQDIPDIPDHLSSEAKSFLKLCLQRDPAARPTAAQLMDHPFAKDHPTSTDGNNIRYIVIVLALLHTMLCSFQNICIIAPYFD
jgi:mitogen-activated protein kinase kinase kinase 3